MEKLTALIHNFNLNCYKQYTKVSPLLGDLLNNILIDIEKFYYSNFWITRYKRRLNNEKIKYNPIELDIIQGLTTEIRENIKFNLYDKKDSFGVSDDKENIGLNNTNMFNDLHIKNVIMHEFGHKQYNDNSFKIIIDLNKKIINNPIDYIKENENLNNDDLKYFTDHNEIRQRIIPIIKEMADNGWSLIDAYNKSQNLEKDDIKKIFKREYILKLIDNLL